MNRVFNGLSSFLFLAPFGRSAHAQNCPALSGEYLCQQSNGKQAHLTVRQSQEHGHPAFDFQTPVEGHYHVSADGSEQSIHTTDHTGTFTATCENGQLAVAYRLKDSHGKPIEMKDIILTERKAIVRILFSFSSSEVKVQRVDVCQPYAQYRKNN